VFAALIGPPPFDFRNEAAFRLLHATFAYLDSLTTSLRETGIERDSLITALALETSNFSSFSEEFPMKKLVPHDKYFLRSLHQEIDLYDRKLADLEKYVQFASMADRAGAESKLLAKRASLAETARQLVADGVEFNPADLPRSFRASAVTSADI
jgi:hypothetical protein